MIPPLSSIDLPLFRYWMTSKSCHMVLELQRKAPLHATWLVSCSCESPSLSTESHPHSNASTWSKVFYYTTLVFNAQRWVRTRNRGPSAGSCSAGCPVFSSVEFSRSSTVIWLENTFYASKMGAILCVRRVLITKVVGRRSMRNLVFKWKFRLESDQPMQPSGSLGFHSFSSIPSFLHRFLSALCSCVSSTTVWVTGHVTYFNVLQIPMLLRLPSFQIRGHFNVTNSNSGILLISAVQYFTPLCP